VPEGDTVWNTARALDRALTGQALTASDFRVPHLAATSLAGWRVTGSVSRGKHLLLRLAGTADARMTLHSHLRMDGAWRTYAVGARWAARPAHLIRAILRTAEAVAVGYHLHELALVPTETEETLVGHLGPDLLGPDWDQAEAVRRLSARPAVAIAEALLDKCELLFLRGISPWTPTGTVPDLAGMVALAHRLLSSNRGRWTQSTTGSLRRGETTYVYGRRAQPCRRCGAPIEKVEQAERVTYWCPTCQPAVD
jgi:endonuclease-8